MPYLKNPNCLMLAGIWGQSGSSTPITSGLRLNSVYVAAPGGNFNTPLNMDSVPSGLALNGVGVASAGQTFVANLNMDA